MKHYSSGMTARLGFAVAVNVEPEILLVDEVLSVGDEAFQRKCLDRIKQFQREGRTILLVTHAADMVRQICDRAAVLDHGNLVAVGPPGEAVLAFRDHLRRKGAEIPADLDDPLLLRNLAGRDHERARSSTRTRPAATSSPSEPVTVRVTYRAPEPRRRHRVLDRDLRPEGQPARSGRTPTSWTATRARCTATARWSSSSSSFPVLDGVYLVSIGLHSHDGGDDLRPARREGRHRGDEPRSRGRPGALPDARRTRSGHTRPRPPADEGASDRRRRRRPGARTGPRAARAPCSAGPGSWSSAATSSPRWRGSARSSSSASSRSSEFGRYQFIFSLLGIVGFIADLRLSRIVLRDLMAVDGDAAGDIVGSYLGLRLVIGVVSYVDRDGVGAASAPLPATTS